MGNASTSAYSTGAPSTTQIEIRDVGDKIRSLKPASSILSALVTRGEMKDGDLKRSKGMIAKRVVDNVRYENYTYTPLAVIATVTSLSSTTLTLSAAAVIPARYTVMNTANFTTARIDSETSTTVKKITSFGTDAFSVTAGDVLLICMPAYEQNSSSPAMLTKSEDNIYNVLQQARFSVGISNVAKNTPTHAVKDYWAHLKMENVDEGMVKTENTLLFGNRPASGNTTTGGAVYGTGFETTRGLWNWAANSYDAENAMTPSRFRADIPQSFTLKTINGMDKVFMFAGSAINAEMQDWVNDRSILAKDGTLEKFGLKSNVFLTSEFEVELIMHDTFNQGALANQALLFKPEALRYCFLRNKDMKPNLNIQSPSTDGIQDEISGMIGVASEDAGNSMLKIKNFL